ncbi:hypothetical protein NDU88_001449 [Pleurodeles waltl]|uniref:Uncharacterized protein n=1 Tax=Pleurodeles waltl TaxID=8319 RepID=A0AAV7R821_PLEWA|nr:hypothetical protein NDU88_001449 [Pleurodeles waltl]
MWLRRALRSDSIVQRLSKHFTQRGFEAPTTDQIPYLVLLKDEGGVPATLTTLALLPGSLCSQRAAANIILWE